MTISNSSRYRLSRYVVPTRYELLFAPDLDAARFDGKVAIDVEVGEQGGGPIGEIVLNAVELGITGAWVSSASGVRVDVRDIRFEEAAERVSLLLSEPLAPDSWTIHLAFEGVLNDKLRGFYRSTYVDDSGDAHVLATTQFESTDARRAFPCFDEPDLKATFAITLIIPERLRAVSNSEVVGEEPVRSRPGWKKLRFAETMPMSTYLVALIVGDLEATEPVDADGVPLRVVHVPGKGHLAEHALEVGAFSLRYFADYYGIAYPADKLDLVAIPDFAAGAMENLGCVTFREALLLVDPDTATQGELTGVADTVAHEIAHMWFGDLVTMRWWNGLWLNEAFATFMEVAAVAAFRPAWERWSEFALERTTAFAIDALESTRPVEYEVHSPEDAEGMFDTLTYQKGGSVLRMVEQYLGPERFRDGIRRYLREHAYGNTETTDLFDAIEAETGEPVRRIMDSWIFQGGFPLITVRMADEGATVHLTQERMSYVESDTSLLWKVPALLCVWDQRGRRVSRLLLEDNSATIELDAPADLVVVNAGGHGFYRVSYEGELFERVCDLAMERLEAVERYALADDAWAAVLAARVTTPQFLHLANGLAAAIEPGLWRLLSSSLDTMDRVLDGDERCDLQAYIRDLAGPLFADLGWAPSAGEGPLVRQLRGTLIRLLGVLGRHGEIQDRAAELHAAYVAGSRSMDADVLAAVVSVVASSGNDADYDLYVDRSVGRFAGRSVGVFTPQEKLRYLFALAEFPSEAQFRSTLDRLFGPDVRTQDAPYVMARMLAHRNHGPIAWDVLKTRWAEVNERFASPSIPRMLSGIRALFRSDVAADVAAFFEDHDVPQAQRTLRQHLEMLRVNVAFRERESARLAS